MQGIRRLKGDFGLHCRQNKNMQFIRDGTWYKVSRVTGPSHNLLAIELQGEGSESSTDVQALPAENGRGSSELSPDDVRQHVLRGVSEANGIFGTSYAVSRIQYVSTDTPSAKIYGVLALSIIERIVQKQI